MQRAAVKPLVHSLSWIRSVECREEGRSLPISALDGCFLPVAARLLFRRSSFAVAYNEQTFCFSKALILFSLA